MKNLLLHRTLIALTLFFGILSVLVTIKRFHWSGDLAALIVDYLAIISLLLLVYFGLTRHWRWMSVAGIMLLMNGFALVNYDAIASDAFRSALAQSDGQDDNTVPPTVALRLMVYNMYFQNNDLGAVVDEVRSHDPDILFLMEYSDAIQSQIETEFTNYPYQLIRPSRMTMGLALFSRIPFDETEIHRFEETRIPIFEAVMQVDGKPFTFVGGHAWPPQPQWGQLHRNQVGSITEVAAQATHPLIVAGDFNASQWSYAMQNLSQQARVANILRLFDFTKTSSPFPLLGLPIDHVLVSPDWEVAQVQYGDKGGSDHLPIVVDLTLR